MLRTMIRNSLLALLFHGGASQAIVTDLFGNGAHLKHEEYYATGEEAFAACIATATEYGYTNPNCHGALIVINPPFIEAGWLREGGPQSTLDKFHLLVYYFVTIQHHH